MSKDLKVTCPDCGAQLRVDSSTGKVIHHGNPAETGDSMDLGDVVRKIEARGASVADKFDAALDAEKKHRAGLEDKFKQAQEKAKQSDDEAAPDNPLDDRWR